jgi:hypothetical protein
MDGGATMRAKLMSPDPQSTAIRLDGRVVAFARGRVLDVRRQPSGLLRLPEPALALAVTVLAQSRALGCRSIRLLVSGAGVFTISMTDFLASSFSVKRAGLEQQLGCALSHFESDLDRKVKAGDTQPALFGADL